MGCKPSKRLGTNLRADDPTIVVGSTILHSDQIVVLGNRCFLPTEGPNGESTIIELDIKDKKISLHRGRAERAVRSGISL